MLVFAAERLVLVGERGDVFLVGDRLAHRAFSELRSGLASVGDRSNVAANGARLGDGVGVGLARQVASVALLCALLVVLDEALERTLGRGLGPLGKDVLRGVQIDRLVAAALR